MAGALYGLFVVTHAESCQQVNLLWQGVWPRPWVRAGLLTPVVLTGGAGSRECP